MFLQIIAYLFLFFLTYWFYICIRYYYISMWGIKGNIPIPLLGTVQGLKDTSSPVKLILNYHKKYGQTFKIMGGIYLGVSIMETKLLEYFLSTTKQLCKGHMYRFLDGWLNTGLLTGDGLKWHKRRKMITPAFHFNILLQFINVFESNADILVQQLEKEVGKGSTDIYNYVTLCALDIISESAMGTSIHAQTGKGNSEYIKSVKKMCEIIVNRTMNPFLHVHFTYRLTGRYREEQKCLRILHNYTNSVIAARKEALKSNTRVDNEDSDVGMKKRTAFLDLLLQSEIDGQPLTDDDIREEVNTFMFAGHDTTTSAISFALFMIAKHPNIQNNIMEEQRVIFGNENGRVYNINDLNEMKYLEAVIKETLRLYPSVPFFARKLVGDYKYSDDVTLPDYSLVLIPAFAIHRDPDNYTNPETFDPERFLDGKVQKPYTYLPFSMGPRNCIGQKFAMMEMKVVISKLLWKYELLPVVPEHKLNLISETTLKSSNGILINIKHRI